MKHDITYPSSDGKTQIHAIIWEPEGTPKAVLQICHGMVDYADRYDDFAQHAAAQGYYVVANDHLGHGASVVTDDQHGYFGHPNGNECVIADIVKTRQEKTNNKRGIGNRGKTKIVVKEHFSENGKTMEELLTDVMLEKAKQTIA